MLNKLIDVITIPLMKCKFTIKNKSFMTMITFKWLLPTVLSLMACKFTFNNKTFITKITLEWHLPIVTSNGIQDKICEQNFYLTGQLH